MKRIRLAAWLLLTATLAFAAQTPGPQQKSAPAALAIKCKGSDGRPCSAKQVQALSDGVFGAKQQHEALALVRNLTLASADGTLKCEQNDGKPCTTPQLDAVKEIGRQQQLFINYNSSKSNSGN
jgi:hypothetical protein